MSYENYPEHKFLTAMDTLAETYGPHPHRFAHSLLTDELVNAVGLDEAVIILQRVQQRVERHCNTLNRSSEEAGQ